MNIHVICAHIVDFCRASNTYAILSVGHILPTFVHSALARKENFVTKFMILQNFNAKN